MELNSTTRTCRLCLETSDNLVNVFTSFQNSTIAAILSKYFWFQVSENDGMPEWLCEICWIQTKTFHNFYKRIEIRQGNYRRAIVSVEIKLERNVSPVDLEPDYLVKHEEVEPPAILDDVLKNKEENSDFEDSNEVNSCNRSENSEISDDEHRPSGTKTNNNSAGNMTRKGYRSLSQSEREDQDKQIREFFNMKCAICNDVEFETLLKAKQHYRKVHEIQGYITCCGRKFNNRHDIVNHICNHTNPDAHRCEQCNKSFKDEKSLKSHIDNHVPLDSREFKCSLCRSSFVKAHTLKNHVQLKHTSKTGEKFPCDKCGKNFRSNLLLGCHIRQVHELTQEYVCEVCARQFKNKQTLQDHVKYEHSATPPPKVQCNICGVWLKHKVGLRKHLERHNDSEPLNCPICNKEVRHKHILYRHISYAHGEKRFQCSICNKAFKCAKKLKEHTAVHSGEDLYNCPYCEKKFKSSANMYSHRKKAHLAEWTRDCPKRSTLTKVSASEDIGTELKT